MTGCGTCAGCIGMDSCDDGTPCIYGCGARAATPWGTCYRCEVDEAGNDGYRDFVDDDEEDG